MRGRENLVSRVRLTLLPVQKPKTAAAYDSNSRFFSTGGEEGFVGEKIGTITIVKLARLTNLTYAPVGVQSDLSLIQHCGTCGL